MIYYKGGVCLGWVSTVGRCSSCRDGEMSEYCGGA